MLISPKIFLKAKVPSRACVCVCACEYTLGKRHGHSNVWKHFSMTFALKPKQNVCLMVACTASQRVSSQISSSRLCGQDRATVFRPSEFPRLPSPQESQDVPHARAPGLPTTDMGFLTPRSPPCLAALLGVIRTLHPGRSGHMPSLGPSSPTWKTGKQPSQT